jgi:hypothetical protein
MYKIAIEGLDGDKKLATELIKTTAEEKYDVCYFNKSPYNLNLKDSNILTNITLNANIDTIVDGVLKNKPDLILFCNARGYFPIIAKCKTMTNTPIAVITAGQEDAYLAFKAIKCDVHIIPVIIPFRSEYLFDKLDGIFSYNKKTEEPTKSN